MNLNFRGIPFQWFRRFFFFFNLFSVSVDRHPLPYLHALKGVIWGALLLFLWWSQLQLSLSVQFSCSVVSDSLQPHELQHARPPCPSPTPGVYSNSCPLSWWWWCHVVPFSSLQSFPTSGSFQMSQFFTSGGQLKSLDSKFKLKSWLSLLFTTLISCSKCIQQILFF